MIISSYCSPSGYDDYHHGLHHARGGEAMKIDINTADTNSNSNVQTAVQDREEERRDTNE